MAQSHPTGIPTFGPRGLRFRSRIEARWAWIFERLGWRWEYEPYDLTGYIPDFILTFESYSKQVLVEVKWDCNIWDPRNYSPHIEKIINSGWKGFYLVLGAAIKREDTGLVVIGIGGRTDRDDRLGRSNEWTTGMVTGEWRLCFGARDLPEATGDSFSTFERYWSDAQNRTQWASSAVLQPEPLAAPARPVTGLVCRVFGFGQIILTRSPTHHYREYKNRQTGLTTRDPDLDFDPSEWIIRTVSRPRFYIRAEYADTKRWTRTGPPESNRRTFRARLTTEQWFKFCRIRDRIAFTELKDQYPQTGTEDDISVEAIIELLARDQLTAQKRIITGYQSGPVVGSSKCVVCARESDLSRVITVSTATEVEPEDSPGHSRSQSVRICPECYWTYDPENTEGVYGTIDFVVLKIGNLEYEVRST